MSCNQGRIKLFNLHPFKVLLLKSFYADYVFQDIKLINTIISKLFIQNDSFKTSPQIYSFCVDMNVSIY